MYLIDGTPLLYRAAHSYTLTTSRGEPSGIVYGAVKILLGLIRKLDTTTAEIVVFWDHGRSRYRTARYPAYKDTPARAASKAMLPGGSFQDQRAAVHAIFQAKGIRQVSVEGIEADDLIAIATTTGTHVVVSDDLDLWQLIGQRGTQVYAPVKEMWVRDRDDCFKLTGLWPEQIAPYKSLSGDPSDGLPGVTGVGDKTAKQLLSVVQDLAELYRRLRTPGDRLPVSDRIVNALLAEEDRVKLWFDLCQPLDWSMLSPAEQAGFLAGWQGPLQTDRTAEFELYESWELYEFRRKLSEVPWTRPIAEPEVPRGDRIARRGMPANPDDWQVQQAATAAQVRGCHACTMRQECSGPVPGNVERATERPWAMIVGRNPGASEDREGRGFVGPAGKRLNQLLVGRAADEREVHGRLIERATTWVTNTAKCWTTGNREPEPHEWQVCAGLFLREEIRAIQPRLILSFGALAMTALTGYTDSIMQRSGTTVAGVEANGIVQYAVLDGGERRWDPVIPPACTIVLLPHPAAALRTRQAELKLQQAGRVVADLLK